MPDSPGQRLAGIFGPRFRNAMAVPQNDMSVKLAKALGAFGQNTQTGMPTPAYQQPFAGLHDEPQALPPFVQPGNAMTEAIGPPPIQQQVTVPAAPPPAQAPAPAALPSPTAAVQPQAVVPPMPAPTQVGPNVQQDTASAVQQLIDARLLPEQWKGAFVNRYGGAG